MGAKADRHAIAVNRDMSNVRIVISFNADKTSRFFPTPQTRKVGGHSGDDARPEHLIRLHRLEETLQLDCA
jgi:hypothetical protein